MADEEFVKCTLNKLFEYNLNVLNLTQSDVKKHKKPNEYEMPQYQFKELCNDVYDQKYSLNRVKPAPSTKKRMVAKFANTLQQEEVNRLVKHSGCSLDALDRKIVFNLEPKKKSQDYDCAITVERPKEKPTEIKDKPVKFPLKRIPRTPKFNTYEFYDVQFYQQYFEKKKLLEIEALKKRKLWIKHQNKLAVDVATLIAQKAGPDWFQDLSNYQMEIVDGLPSCINADKKQNVFKGTQNALYNLGIYPRVKTEVLKRLINSADDDPIRFFFLVHREIVILETEDYENEFFESKGIGKRISPFSLNERLLLSAVFHIHFPTFLKKLDDILPGAYKQPKIMWAKKPPKPKQRLHPSPYLQPQPINDQCWYEDRAEQDLEKKVLRQIYLREEAMRKKKSRREIERKENDKKFSKETDEMVKYAHIFEMNLLENPKTPSRSSSTSDMKPEREGKNHVIERMFFREETTESSE